MIFANLFAILAGIGLLTLSADRFIDAASSLAKIYKLSPLLVGLLLVAIGTSAPEIVVSFLATLQGAGHLAIGNALGSNIANIGLVLGITVLVTPVVCSSSLLRHEIPLLFAVTLLAGFLLWDLRLEFIDAALLISALVAVIYFFLKWAKADKSFEEQLLSEVENAPEHPELSTGKTWAAFLITLVAIMCCAQAIVWGATELATTMGIPQVIIGMTIVAVGTSLPELAATLGSALKGHHDIALGTVIGSNLFNLITVLPWPGFIGGTEITQTIFNRDVCYVLLLTFILGLSILLRKRTSNVISKGFGAVMLLSYIGYYVIIYVGM